MWASRVFFEHVQQDLRQQLLGSELCILKISIKVLTKLHWRRPCSEARLPSHTCNTPSLS